LLFVEIGCQRIGAAKFVAAQIRVALFGSPTKLKVILRFVFRLMLVTSGVTTVSEASLRVALP
jgi:hypothetical protein